MSRPIVFLACGLTVAAAVVFLLLGLGDTEDPYQADGADESGVTELGDPDAAALHGTATDADQPLAADAAPAGKESIYGVVLDPDGKPVAGIEVTARVSGAMWDDPKGYNDYYGVTGRLRRAKRSLNDPAREGQDESARTTTDAEGKFQLEGLDLGSYQVRAHPEPPLLSLTASASLSTTWKSNSITIHLLEGTRLTGKVVDANDRAVAAVVKAVWTDWGGGINRSWTSDPVRSDEAEGTFALPAVPDGTLRFTVTIPGRLRVTGLKVDAPTDEEVVLRLPGGTGAVSGTVTDQDEKAIRGALVAFTIEAPEGGARAKVQTVTDGSGAYVFHDIPTGKLTNAEVLAPGFAALSEAATVARWSPFTVGEESQTLDFKLLRGGTVRGRVLVAGTEEGLGEATVYVFVATAAVGYSAQAPLRTKTNEKGEFQVEGVPSGRLVAIAVHPTHYLKALQGATNQPNYYDPNRVVTSPAGLTRLMPRNGATIEIDVSLEPGFEIEGLVVDPNGQPVEEAGIHVKNVNLSQTLQRWGINWWTQFNDPIYSDADGRFTLGALPPGKSYELYAKKKGFAGQYAEAVKVDPEQATPTVTLKLVAGATVRGRVVGEDGRGISGAAVNIWGTNQGLAGDRTNATTDAEGAFEITGLAAGDYQYWVQLGGFNSIANQNQIKDLKEGEVREGIEVKLAGGESVSGKLIDSKGKPVQYQSLQLLVEGTWYHANTDTEGRFSFANVKRGKAKLHIQTNNGPNKPLGEDFESPADDLEYTYDKPPTNMIEGSILDVDGKPVPLCSLEITGKGGGSSQNVYYPGGSSGQEVVYGVFRRSVTGTAPYRISVKSARDAEGNSMNLAPHSQTLKELPKGPLEIRLSKGKEITGTVTDSGGTGIADVTVRTGASVAQTDASGRFKLGGLGQQAVLQFVVPDGYVKPGQRTAKAGDHVEVTVLPGFNVEGRAFAPDGTPIKSGWVNANWQKAGDAPAGNANGQVQADGRFTLKGIPEGVLVSVTVNGGWVNGAQEHAPKTVKDVRPGTTDLEVHLGTSAVIEGRVVDSDGNPWTGGWAFAKRPDGQWVGGMQQVQPDGSFKLSGLAAGETYDIGVQRQSNNQQSDTIKATAPSSGVVLKMAKTAKLVGRIDGGDAKGFRVTAQRASGKGNAVSGAVKADGSFVIENVSEGEEWIVTAHKRADDRYAQSEPTTAGGPALVLRLKKGESISGRVTEGGAAPSTKVWVMCSGNGLGTWTRSEADGTYTVKGLPPGSYKLRAMHPTTRTTTENKDADTGATGVDFDL